MARSFNPQYGDVRLGAVDSMTVCSTEGRETLQLTCPRPLCPRKKEDDNTHNSKGAPSPFTARKLTGPRPPQNKNRQHDGDDDEQFHTQLQS